MVYNCVFWLNSFPHGDSVHSTISPRAIMTGQRITYDKHCRLEFGTYVQTHKKHDNSLEPRTSGAIALRPSGNKQGGHYFLSLHTRKRILRNNWTVLPMPNDVVDAVHRLAAASKQAGGITFTDKDGNIITDDDKDEIEEDTPIPVPNNNNVPTMESTDNTINDDSTTTGGHDQQQEENGTITGVHENETNKTNDDDTSEHDPDTVNVSSG